MPSLHRDGVPDVSCSTGELRQIQLFRHARRRQQWRVSFVQQSNIELFVSPRRRFQLDFLPQGIPIIGAFPQQGAQHVQLVGQE